jgi:hypothetical protein
MANSESKTDCPTSCEETFYGCCLDNVSTARGTGYAGCPKTKKDSSVTHSNNNKNIIMNKESNSEEHVEDEDVDSNITVNDDKGPIFPIRDEKADNEARNNLTNNGLITCAETKYECCPDGVLASLVSR